MIVFKLRFSLQTAIATKHLIAKLWARNSRTGMPGANGLRVTTDPPVV